METNIIKSLVKSDKDIQKKLQSLQKEYEAFLEKLSEFKHQEEIILEEQLKIEIQQLKKDYDLKLKRLESQLKADVKKQSNFVEIKNMDQEAENLFQQILKLK